jgi:NADH:ubiquinone oxidoreductase subunit 3 (subunit A)
MMFVEMPVETLAEWVWHPLFALAAFLALSLALYHWAGKIAARGSGAGAKRLPYACGQDLTPAGERLSYKRFFRLALMFVVVHMAALVAMLLPLVAQAPGLAVAYLLGTGVCVDILTRGGE